MTKLKNWTLTRKVDISPSKWYPLEKREYLLPNNEVVNDYYVSTLEDVAMIIPVTSDNKIIMVRQFKAGAGKIIIEFPAGRFEKSHGDILETAVKELLEETGIESTRDDLIHVADLFISPSKATTTIHIYLAKNAINSKPQKFDHNEEIEVVMYETPEIEELMTSGQIVASDTIAAWHLVKEKGLIQL